MYEAYQRVGVSTEPVHPLNPSDPLETEPPPPESTNPIVGSRLPPIEPDPFGSVGKFPPKNPKPLNPTIKSKKSGEIQRFSDKDLLEIHCNLPDLAIFFIL